MGLLNALAAFRVTLGQRLPLFTPGRTKPSLNSCEDVNKLVITLNALTNLKLRPSGIGKWYVSDGNVVLDLSDLFGPTGGGGAPGGGNMKWMGQWSNLLSYAVGDVVYVNYQIAGQSNNITRVLYICLVANSNQAPAFVGGENTYWRCLNFPTPALPMTITGISTSTLTCTDPFGNTGITVKIPFNLSSAKTTGSINSVSWNYSGWAYSSGSQQRTAVTSGVSMTQIIVPPYTTGDSIIAAMVYKGSSPYYEWQEISPSRNWGKLAA